MCAAALAALIVASLSGSGAERSPTHVSFHREIRPILSDKCYPCHGPDPQARKAGLRFDRADSLAEVVTPGDLEDSELWYRITAERETRRMPPPKSHLSLSPEEIDRLRRWIEEGARWEGLWALEPARSPRVPEVERVDWCRNEIDRFILARLESEGLTPSEDADRETWIRRVTFDLTGLPPLPAEIDAFLGDSDADAHERQVDRLLASPRFGERMAVDWLDLARYADTYGYQADVYRPMWPWRDWVVRAFNDNLRFDAFITWQLAGDLLPEPTRDQVLATAFQRNHRQTNEGGSVEEEFRAEYVADRTNTFGTAFLGLTLECARCHDHKFDPLTQEEYYGIASYFDNIDESGLYSHFTDATPTPTLLLPDPAREVEIAAIELRIAEEEHKRDGLRAACGETFQEWLDSAAPTLGEVGGLIGDFSLDSVDGATVPNRAREDQPGKAQDGPSPVGGKVAGALELSGENGLSLPVGAFTRDDPFSIGLWIWTPDRKDRAVILHRSRAWTDAGSRGYQLLIEDGRLSAALVHFWPGNAIGVRTKTEIPIGEWVHVAVTYDGSSRAAGLRLFLDGKPAEREIVRDHLSKNITGGGADALLVGNRFRDRGFKGGRVDEIRVFERRLTALEVASLVGEVDLGAETPDRLLEHYLGTLDPAWIEAGSRLHELRLQRSRLVDPVAEIMVLRELPEPRQTYVLLRGAYDARGKPVDSGTPSCLPPLPEAFSRDRLGLARWLTSPEHPVTARVAVNRFWQALFGRGLVATAEDFGSQGSPPSHPELLDWLATRFVESGWDTKALLRTIVTSATYRQRSETSPELRARDPENVLLARGPSHRLPAEMIRDAALFASGLLVEKRGGPPVKPYQPPGLWEEKSGLAYERDVGEGSHRRSLYTFWKRTSPPPAMMTLDAAKRDVCVARRQRTATPLQALVLLNDPQYVEAARAFAERVLSEAVPDPEARATHAFRLATSRLPSAREVAVLLRLLEEQSELFRDDPDGVAAFLGVGDHKPKEGLDPVELAAYSVLASALLNHHDAVLKR